MQKIKLLLVIMFGAIIMAACQGNITLDVTSERTVTIKEGETYQIEATASKGGVSYQIEDPTLISISASGLITGLKEGSTSVMVYATSDESKAVRIDIVIEKQVTLSTPQSTLHIAEGDTHQLVWTTNDSVTFSSSQSAIFEVSATGLITAKTMGTAELTITSQSDSTVFVKITVNVTKDVELIVDEDSYVMFIGQTKELSFTTNDELTFTSSNENIATVSAEGIVTAIAYGTAEITMTSKLNPLVFEKVTVASYQVPTALEAHTDGIINMHHEHEVHIDITPSFLGFPLFSLTSSDESVIQVVDGKLIPLKIGTATITVTSLADASITDELVLTVSSIIIVDAQKSDGSTLQYEGLTFEYGTTLFSTIEAALDHAVEGSTIKIIEGTYSEDIEININHVTLLGSMNAEFRGTMTVDADFITVKGLTFRSTAQIFNQQTIQGFVFEENFVDQITHTGSFIKFENTSDVMIRNNTFQFLSATAIELKDIQSGDHIIEKNIITQGQTSISITLAESYQESTTIQISRNDISHVGLGFLIDLTHMKETHPILAYSRFNAVKDYVLGASLVQETKFDLTLNYWGKSTPVVTEFENVTLHDLRGYYATQASIISESKFRDDMPVKVLIKNPVDELFMGDHYQFEYEVLPLEFTTDRIRFITSNPDVLLVNTITGDLTPVRSGQVTITVRSTQDITINSMITLVITTNPGIELSTSHVYNNLEVGNTFTLSATPFPYTVADEPVVFSSSNEAVATILQNGTVHTHQIGLAVLTAALISDQSIKQTFTIEVRDSLDENDLLDLLTMSMVSYTTHREWMQYGTGFNYIESRYESVSRFLFDELNNNTSKMLPISPGIRPGIKKPAHPDGITTYNPENVYWVVIHETANTNPGAGALSHANYLWNAAQAGTVLNVSWHYTMDDTYLYQHVPEDEIAYHAGDGSSLPRVEPNPYLGGGNRNGVGIEMSVAQNEDMYRTIQRTAKLSADILVRYNLPVSHQKYHQSFANKVCPQGLIRGNMLPLFEELVLYEYKVRTLQGEAEISFESHNPDLVDHTGRVIQMPDQAQTVSYTVTVTLNGVETSRTFYTYLPGTVH